MVVDGVDLGLVGTAEFALQLKIVGRVGEDQIGAAFGQRVHALHAVALDHLIQLQIRHPPTRFYQQSGDNDSAKSAGQESC